MKADTKFTKLIVGSLMAMLVSALAIPVFAQSSNSTATVSATCVANVATVEWSGFFGGRYSEAVSIYIDDKVVASGMGTFGELQKDVLTLSRVQDTAPTQIKVKAYGSRTGYVDAGTIACTAQPVFEAETPAAATAPQFAPPEINGNGAGQLVDEFGTTPFIEGLAHSVGTEFSRDGTWRVTRGIAIDAAIESARTGEPVLVILERWREEYYADRPASLYEALRVYCYPPGYIEVWHTSNDESGNPSRMMGQFHIALVANEGAVSLPTHNGGFIIATHAADNLTIDAQTGAGQAKTISYAACLASAHLTEETVPKMSCNADAVVQQQALIAEQQAYVAKLEPIKTAVATRDEYAYATSHLAKLQNALTSMQAGCAE